MEKRRKNAEILDRSIAFFYDMIYQINTAIQEQDLNRKSFKFENHFYNRRKHIMKTTVHIISHSHWDREWYQSFEKHRMKLIELVDNILEKAENDPDFSWMDRRLPWTITWKCARKNASRWKNASVKEKSRLARGTFCRMSF